MAGRVVSVRYVPATFTVPANTVQAAAVSQNLVLGDVELQSVTVLIPPGHSGLTGFAVEYAGERIVPWADRQSWIIGDGAEPAFEVGFEVSAPVVLRGYNLDVFDHAFYVRAKVTDLAALAVAGPAALVTV